MSGEVLVFVSDERERRSLLTGTTGPTDPVGVGVDVPRHIVIHHCPDVWDIKTTRYNRTL